MFDYSLVFQELYEDRAQKREYMVNDHKYNIVYFLFDGIYLKWATFVKLFAFLKGQCQNYSLNI